MWVSRCWHHLITAGNKLFEAQNLAALEKTLEPNDLKLDSIKP